jgi:hypothetical protein
MDTANRVRGFNHRVGTLPVAVVSKPISTMARLLLLIVPVLLHINIMTHAFPMTALLQIRQTHRVVSPQQSLLYSSTTEKTEQEETVTTSKASTKSSIKASTSSKSSSKATLGLLTFDLDDTIYPLAPVIQEANAAFAKAMERYGFPNIQSDDITKRSVQIRNEIAETDPQLAATLSHTEIRKLAIRKEMELVMFHRKLSECANDWATNVESLGPAVVTSARKYVPISLYALFHIIYTRRKVCHFTLAKFMTHPHNTSLVPNFCTIDLQMVQQGGQ